MMETWNDGEFQTVLKINSSLTWQSTFCLEHFNQERKIVKSNFSLTFSSAFYPE